MHSFLQQYPYSIGEHTLTCSLSSHGDIPEAETGKKEVKREDGSKGSSGLKKIPEGTGTVQKPAGNPSGEARKGQIPTPNVPEEIPAGQLEIPESQAGGAARESPVGMDVEGLDPGIPMDPAGSKSPGERSEEKPAPLSGAGMEKSQDEPELEIPKEDEEPSAPAVEALESSSKAVPAAGGTPGAVPGMSPSSEEAPAVSPGVTQPSTEPAAPEKTRVPEAGKSSRQTATEKLWMLQGKNWMWPEQRERRRRRNPCCKSGKIREKRHPRLGQNRRRHREKHHPRVGKTLGMLLAPGGGGAAALKSSAGSAGKQKEDEELFPFNLNEFITVDKDEELFLFNLDEFITVDEDEELFPFNLDEFLTVDKDEELFPFNLDEFVTVDEVLEEAESPVMPRRNPPRGKRKEAPKANPSELAPKKRKGKSCGAEGELSFVTLDEIGEEEEEDAPVPLPGVDPQGLVVVDEVVEEEELSEAVKDPQALLTLDEISEQEEPGSHGNGPRAEFEERDLKAEPLVTVDEIGEVEELLLNEPAELSAAEEGKANPGDGAASQVPDDPNALVTVDEIQEDNEDNPLVTLDEVNEDEDDFLADFNHLKEELNFVTVDEVGDEEEESTFPGKNLPEDEDDEDIVAVAGPEEIGILGDTNPEDEMAEISKPKAQLGSEDAEPKPQQKKTPFPGVPKTQSTPKALDILVPKAGFFCQICSLFYADEPSMINHCRTPLHRQNMEKFMAKQQESGGEEPSSR
ncbi:zinc finger protein 638 [Geospiza fortis]|uniref:Zinc finger protein 638 n=1 Tax=Geospiza fortis TaxID=48883 RepID=A0A8N5F3P4_GEOFO|nr:zinc finger protein 638 [Geospiza fortis]